ncbi:MAG: transposase [bacterium]
MKTKLTSKQRLRTIWRLPDELWAELRPLLPPEKPPGTPGRPVVPFRQVVDGTLYVLRTGCQWKALPREYGSASTCHRRFQAWVQAGIFEHLWAKMPIKGYDFPVIATVARRRHYVPHIRCRGETVPRHKRHLARRWVVERTGSWHNRFRKLLIRFEKRVTNYLGLVHLACCLIVYRLTVLG